MKRKAPSQDAMRKALATFKRKHPGKPIPGFLRKYAGGAARVNPIKRVRRKKPVRTMDVQDRRSETIARRRVKRSINKRSVRVVRDAFAVDVSRDGKSWKRIAFARTPENAKIAARAMGTMGFHARAVRTK